MKRLLKRLLFAAILVMLIFALLPLGRVYRLMRLAEAPLGSIRRVEAQDGWYDLLEYTDCYEWAVLRVADFTPPVHWSAGDASPEAVPETFDDDFILALPENAARTAWYYVPVDESLPFEEQEWFAAFYDAAEGLLALYRGYALYGLD